MGLKFQEKLLLPQLKVQRKKQSGVSGYISCMSEHENYGYQVVKVVSKASKTTYTKTKLIKGKTYYFKIWAYSVIEGKKVLGDGSKAVSVKKK